MKKLPYIEWETLKSMFKNENLQISYNIRNTTDFNLLQVTMLLWKTILVDLRHWNLSDVKISKLYYGISWKKGFENASAIFVDFDMV